MRLVNRLSRAAAAGLFVAAGAAATPFTYVLTIPNATG